MIPRIKTRNGAEIPALGLGTWQLVGESCSTAVDNAVRLGYTHIDTAEIYQNEFEVGKAIAGRRDGLFLTSKVFFHHLRRDDVFAACLGSVHRLGTGQIDLYLIHYPNPQVAMRETLEAMARLVDMGVVGGIGVSNFTIRHLEEAMRITEIPILVNQVEFHPFLYQKELLAFCQDHGIVLTAYSPLARGLVFQDETVRGVASKHGRTQGQISLRWCYEKGCVVIPKATSETHIRENLAIFDFELDEEDRWKLDRLPQRRLLSPPWADFS
jgi:diketogulonate reductase-like aldo/keto reductase